MTSVMSAGGLDDPMSWNLPGRLNGLKQWDLSCSFFPLGKERQGSKIQKAGSADCSTVTVNFRE